MLIGCPFPGRKCLSALALLNTKPTGLLRGTGTWKYIHMYLNKPSSQCIFILFMPMSQEPGPIFIELLKLKKIAKHTKFQLTISGILPGRKLFNNIFSLSRKTCTTNGLYVWFCCFLSLTMCLWHVGDSFFMSAANTWPSIWTASNPGL